MSNEFELMHITRSGASWSSWSSLGGPFTSVHITTDGRGTTYVLANQTFGSAVLATRSGGQWAPIEALGQRKALAAAAQPGRLDLLLRYPNGVGATHHQIFT